MAVLELPIHLHTLRPRQTLKNLKVLFYEVTLATLYQPQEITTSRNGAEKKQSLLPAGQWSLPVTTVTSSFTFSSNLNASLSTQARCLHSPTSPAAYYNNYWKPTFLPPSVPTVHLVFFSLREELFTKNPYPTTTTTKQFSELSH